MGQDNNNGLENVIDEETKRLIKRETSLKRLQEDLSEETLWNAVIAFQGYQFNTLRGLPFFYVLRIGRTGEYTRELVINRRKDSKTLSWSSVRLAFEKAKEIRGQVVKRPKDLGDIRGISYVFAMFVTFGIIKGFNENDRL